MDKAVAGTMIDMAIDGIRMHIAAHVLRRKTASLVITTALTATRTMPWAIYSMTDFTIISTTRRTGSNPSTAALQFMLMTQKDCARRRIVAERPQTICTIPKAESS